MLDRPPSRPSQAALQKQQRARWSKNAKACRARKKCGVICAMVQVNERMIDKLVRLGHVREFEDNPQMIAQAIQALIESLQVE